MVVQRPQRRRHPLDGAGPLAQRLARQRRRILHKGGQHYPIRAEMEHLRGHASRRSAARVRLLDAAVDDGARPGARQPQTIAPPLRLDRVDTIGKPQEPRQVGRRRSIRRERRNAPERLAHKKILVGREAAAGLRRSVHANIEFGAEIELEDIVIRAGGVDLHVVAAGAPGAPLVILLHGFPEFWYGWRGQFGPLIEAGFRVVAPDQRGYGQAASRKGPRPTASATLQRTSCGSPTIRRKAI